MTIKRISELRNVGALYKRMATPFIDGDWSKDSTVASLGRFVWWVNSRTKHGPENTQIESNRTELN